MIETRAANAFGARGTIHVVKVEQVSYGLKFIEEIEGKTLCGRPVIDVNMPRNTEPTCDSCRILKGRNP